MHFYFTIIFFIFSFYLSCGKQDIDSHSLPSENLCEGEAILQYSPIYMDTVNYYREGEGVNKDFSDYQKAINGVRGGGKYIGSLDVVSLGNGGIIVLSSSKYVIKNGDGCDFKIFENPFVMKKDNYDYYYMEVATVWVTTSPEMPNPEDDSQWIKFPVKYDSSAFPGNKDRFLKGFAGVNPVFFNHDCFRINPKLDTAGGDCFDIQELIDKKYISSDSSIYFIRLKDGGDKYNEGHSCCKPYDFDLDGIIIINYSNKTDQ